MISSDDGIKTTDNNFNILERVGRVLDNHPNLKTIESLIESLKQKSESLYRNYIARIIRELRAIYVNTQDKYKIEYDKWNGADCGFMYGAFLALESKLELLPIVRHVPAFKELDALSKGLYGRFYLSLLPKRSLALSDLNMYMKHLPMAMSFVQDIPNIFAEQYLVRDRAMLAKHAVTGNIHDKILLFPIHFEESLREGIEMPINKHLDFLEQCSQHYDNIIGAQGSRNRQLMTDYVADFLDSISSHMISKDTRNVNYMSRHFLAMLSSMKNREQWDIFAKKDTEKTLLVLKSKVEDGKTITKM
uniref:Uncharacterized protein n=1 Tax=Romanomermis culicivorax TaxID=13658 RepID=A0A915HI36_ROMCU